MECEDMTIIFFFKLSVISNKICLWESLEETKYFQNFYSKDESTKRKSFLNAGVRVQSGCLFIFFSEKIVVTCSRCFSF